MDAPEGRGGRLLTTLNMARKTTMDAELLKRPCKIWASYGGHCVEKNLDSR